MLVPSENLRIMAYQRSSEHGRRVWALYQGLRRDLGCDWIPVTPLPDQCWAEKVVKVGLQAGILACRESTGVVHLLEQTYHLAVIGKLLMQARAKVDSEVFERFYKGARSCSLEREGRFFEDSDVEERICELEQEQARREQEARTRRAQEVQREREAQRQRASLGPKQRAIQELMREFQEHDTDYAYFHESRPNSRFGWHRDPLDGSTNYRNKTWTQQGSDHHRTVQKYLDALILNHPGRDPYELLRLLYDDEW